jgi:MarR family transcriptional regulator for hemolysin
MPEPPTIRGQDPNSDAALRVHMSWWLVGTGRAWHNLLDERLRFSGQTQPRWRVLAWAQLEPGINQSELSERMSVSSATLVGIIDGLVRQGLLERRESVDDRRIKKLHLTPAAHPIVDQISREVLAIRDGLLRDVSRQEMEICLSVLERIRHNIAAYGDDTPSRRDSI